MQRLTLPNISENTSLEVALSRIRESKTRAVVVGASGAVARVIVTGDILEERNRALDDGKDPGAIPISLVKASTIGLFPHGSRAQDTLAELLAPTPGNPTNEERDYLTNFFAENDSRYFVQSMDQGEAIVVTASERLSAALSNGLSVCKCSGNPVHSFEPWQLDDLKICNKAHRKPVTCGPA